MSKEQREYKDSIFRMLFKDRKNLLSLYNAVNGTDYSDPEALERAVDECIREGILRDFLRKNRAEALEMSWYEYNEELHLKNEREYGYEQGMERGIKQGIKQEHQRAEQQLIQVREQHQQEIMRMQAEIERLKQQVKAEK